MAGINGTAARQKLTPKGSKHGIGADGEKGLRRILDIIKDELSTALGLVGLTDINDVTSEIIAKKFIENMKY